MNIETKSNNLREAEEQARETRIEWEDHMKKIDWDMEKADNEFIEKMKQLWDVVVVANDKFNEAYLDLKKTMFGL